LKKEGEKPFVEQRKEQGHEKEGRRRRRGLLRTIRGKGEGFRAREAIRRGKRGRSCNLT